jgi:hypothetical protein
MTATPRAEARSGWKFRDNSFMNGPWVQISDLRKGSRSDSCGLRQGGWVKPGCDPMLWEV